MLEKLIQLRDVFEHPSVLFELRRDKSLRWIPATAGRGSDFVGQVDVGH